MAWFSTNEDADDVQSFFEAHPCPEASQVIAQTIEKIRARAASATREAPTIVSEAFVIASVLMNSKEEM